ncbi:MAG: iron-containing alcohol dehydrogenase, partial [Sideroxyarcus sp.]|nr:iron-containing alcohol dehydrogenase [Sideroxyarcus sp.]
DAECRLKTVFAIIANALNCTPDDVPADLARWVAAAGLPRLSELGLRSEDHAKVAQAALTTSSMKGNPMPLGVEELQWILAQAG